MTASGEVQTREEATVYVKELDLFVTKMLLGETPAVLSLGELCDDHGYTHHWTSGQKPTSHQKWQNTQLQCSEPRTIRCPGSPVSSTSFSLDSLTSSPKDSVVGTENPATERSEIMTEESRRYPSRGSAETENTKNMETTKNCEVKYCKMCRNGFWISKRIWWIRMFNHMNTLPATLMNYQWSREQKWNRVRVSMVSTRTFRRTQISISA